MSETIVSTQALVDHYRPLYAEYQRLVERFASDDADFTPGSPNWNRCAAALHEAGWSIGDLNAHTIRLAALTTIIAPASQPDWVGPTPAWTTHADCQFRRDEHVLDVSFLQDVGAVSVVDDWVLDMETASFTRVATRYWVCGEKFTGEDLRGLVENITTALGIDTTPTIREVG